MSHKKTDEDTEELFNHYFLDIKSGWKHQGKVGISSLINFC